MAIRTTHATDAERMPDAIRQTQPHNGRVVGRETVWGEIDDHCFLLFALHLRFTTHLKPHFETYVYALHVRDCYQSLQLWLRCDLGVAALGFILLMTVFYRRPIK